ncbi:2-C-methyl-D-erythritol 4-phosphate cytidylyltransferase [Arcticibacter tournemirensis]|uniref:2-C-methyl-D-erythritol 4-phosphate cytidylyltransferase n=1 Tax=Arcticibacter tournemirensis TaxID=699437 RepID=A0A5M9H7W8_9SPHI|nr:2-C-methyl-D-erythritol 4-phosphate cytidylyltransferase [Arcticibacter tournemirensis]KAA8482399.1 2-C-methyl-D-erythritol 4-phosphate cytidylyltransferase [Arcticibacter tournemirensis]TQM51718.1 2-C-methyl-D-erythritol 4-phosphate cytidylyltransferase [Arcticibacter tournemirensis]
MKNYVIILAGGSGNRFQGDLPKQFSLLDSRPVLMHTISAYQNSTISPDIILVMNKNYFGYWDELCRQYNFRTPYIIVEGGKERFYSVKQGLNEIIDDGIVGIHDGVRPFVTDKLIIDAFLTAKNKGNAVPAVTAINTIRQSLDSKSSIALDRNTIHVVQNPQVFRVEEIRKAYKQLYDPLFTDDATVAEKYGININLIEGDRRNIKITHPLDLAIAHSILEYNQKTSLA